jgi:UDP-N-acetylmuramoyl-tripeptide--D-alanyl-D-alanine ligase
VGQGDVQATDLHIGWDGVKFQISAGGPSVEAWLPVPAEHMVRNAALAVAAGLRMGLSLEEAAAGLAKIELTSGRLQHKIVGGLKVLDDSYNANPDSVKAALRTLRQLPVSGRRIAVLGRMAELGDHSLEQHLQVGRAAAENGIDILIGIGEEGAQLASGAGKGVETHVFSDHAGVAAFLRKNATGDDLVLLKGSRSARMETVLTYFNESA